MNVVERPQNPGVSSGPSFPNDFSDMPRLLPFHAAIEETSPMIEDGPPQMTAEEQPQRDVERSKVEEKMTEETGETEAVPKIAITSKMDVTDLVEKLMAHMDPEQRKQFANAIQSKVAVENTEGKGNLNEQAIHESKKRESESAVQTIAGIESSLSKDTQTKTINSVVGIENIVDEEGMEVIDEGIVPMEFDEPTVRSRSQMENIEGSVAAKDQVVVDPKAEFARATNELSEADVETIYARRSQSKEADAKSLRPRSRASVVEVQSRKPKSQLSEDKAETGAGDRLSRSNNDASTSGDIKCSEVKGISVTMDACCSIENSGVNSCLESETNADVKIESEIDTAVEFSGSVQRSVKTGGRKRRRRRTENWWKRPKKSRREKKEVIEDPVTTQDITKDKTEVSICSEKLKRDEERVASTERDVECEIEAEEINCDNAAVTNGSVDANNLKVRLRGYRTEVSKRWNEHLKNVIESMEKQFANLELNFGTKMHWSLPWQMLNWKEITSR